jgi:single-strand DNA-binding protein
MNLNKTIIAGRLTRDPELKALPNGNAVTELGLAVNQRTKKGEEWVDDPIFLDVSVWGRQAENACQYLKKGSVALVEGRLTMDQWEDKQSGLKRSKIKITAQNLQFGPRLEGQTQSGASVTSGDEIPF